MSTLKKAEPEASTTAADPVRTTVSGHDLVVPVERNLSVIERAGIVSRGVSGGTQRRTETHRWLSGNRLLFLIMVVLPTVLATIYYAFIASGLYVVETQMLVTSSTSSFSPGSSSSGSSGVGSSPFSTTPGMPLQSFAVEQYIQSPDIVGTLQERVDLRAKWSRPSADWFSRVSDKASNVSLGWAYWWYTDVDYDPLTGLIDLKVKAFSAADAMAISTAIVSASDALVDSLNERARKDTVGFAEDEVRKTASRLADAQVAVESYRREHAEVDPGSTAQGLGGVISGIEGNLAQAQTALATMQSSMGPASPSVIQMKARIKALEAQRTQEQSRVSEPVDNVALAERLNQYTRLQTEQQLQLVAYQTAVQLLETAEADVQHQHLYLVPFVKPTLPDESTRPIRSLMVAIVFSCSLVIYGIVSLSIATIREHSRS
jgi:capsular polysaccharide transport system permease protein